MRRFWPVLALAVAVTACTGSSYTVEGANIDSANERAARYCNNRAATAQLEQVHQKGGSSVETYRCVAEE
ncbi:MAG TPA: hypothetical protein VJO12_05440 [Stellaceae bacterium]|nr:hypothetical protein [Stellaceae bacterium]